MKLTEPQIRALRTARDEGGLPMYQIGGGHPSRIKMVRKMATDWGLFEKSAPFRITDLGLQTLIDIETSNKGAD